MTKTISKVKNTEVVRRLNSKHKPKFFRKLKKFAWGASILFGSFAAASQVPGASELIPKQLFTISGIVGSMMATMAVTASLPTTDPYITRRDDESYITWLKTQYKDGHTIGDK